MRDTSATIKYTYLKLNWNLPGANELIEKTGASCWSHQKDSLLSHDENDQIFNTFGHL